MCAIKFEYEKEKKRQSRRKLLEYALSIRYWPTRRDAIICPSTEESKTYDWFNRLEFRDHLWVKKLTKLIIGSWIGRTLAQARNFIFGEANNSTKEKIILKNNTSENQKKKKIIRNSTTTLDGSFHVSLLSSPNAIYETFVWRWSQEENLKAKKKKKWQNCLTRRSSQWSWLRIR